MSSPTKKRGFRKITVRNSVFYWNVVGQIDIRPLGKKANQLLVDYGWFDELLYINDPKDKPNTFEPKVVTPGFVQQAIVFAVEHGWNTEERLGLFKLKYRGGQFNTC